MISAQLFVSVIVIFAIVHMMLGGCAYLIFLERKVCSWCQDRIGPNRTNFSFGQDNLWRALGMDFMNKWKFAGFGQALADGIKLFFKEDYTPPRADRVLFILAPIMVIIPALMGWAVIPWGGLIEVPTFSLGDVPVLGWVLWFIIDAMHMGAIPLLGDALLWIEGFTVVGDTVAVTAAPLDIGVIYILAVGSLAVYGVVLGAFASNNKYAFFGGVRATAQMISYEIPMGLCVLVAILTFHTADAGAMVHLQAGSGSAGAWGIFQHPLLAAIFFTCVLAECNRTPFDLAEAESELIGGYHTEYSSMKWALFFLGEYMHMITGSAFFIVLFLGGWDLIPFVADLPIYVENTWLGLLLVAIKANIFIAKVLTLLFIMMWIRWTLPRFRFDQLMRLAWQGLIPLTLLVLLVTGVMIYLDITQWWAFCLANIGVAVICSVIAPKLPKGPPINRKVRLAGSRFYPPLAEDI